MESKQNFFEPGMSFSSAGLIALGGIATERATKEQNEVPAGGRTSEGSLLGVYEKAPTGKSTEKAPRSTSPKQEVRNAKERNCDIKREWRKNRSGFSEGTSKQSKLASGSKLETTNSTRKGLKKFIPETKMELHNRLFSMMPLEGVLLPGKSAFCESDSDFEDDFNTRCELRRLESSFLPLKPDLDFNNKENTAEFSVKPIKTEAERQQIREKIDRLRRLAKRRSSKERFTVFSRRTELRSPATIVNDVTSGVTDLAGMQEVEKEMRLKLADLQKKYREKARELARLQPKCKDW